MPLVGRHLPQLSHGAVRVWRPRNSVDLRCIVPVGKFFAPEHHSGAIEIPLQLQVAALVVNPQLLPTARSAVIKVVAGAGEC